MTAQLTTRAFAHLFEAFRPGTQMLLDVTRVRGGGWAVTATGRYFCNVNFHGISPVTEL